jgi:hypothetical protein
MASKKKAGTRKKAPGVKKPSVKKARSVATKSAKECGMTNIILSYKSLEDPAHDEIESVKKVISGQRVAKILRERPGMLQVAVPSAEKSKAHEDLRKLRKWNVSEEGIARIKKK